MPYIITGKTPREICDTINEDVLNNLPNLPYGTQNSGEYTEFVYDDIADFTSDKIYYANVMYTTGTAYDNDIGYKKSIPVASKGNRSYYVSFIVRASNTAGVIRPYFVKTETGTIGLMMRTPLSTTTANFKNSDDYNKLINNNRTLLYYSGFHSINTRSYVNFGADYYGSIAANDVVINQVNVTSSDTRKVGSIGNYGAGNACTPDTVTPEYSGYKMNGNIPVFNYDNADGIYNWITKGDRSGEIDVYSYSVHYKVYADVVEKSKVYYQSSNKIVWDSNDIQEIKAGDTNVSIKTCPVRTLSPSTTEEYIEYLKNAGTFKSVPFTNGNTTFTYNEIKDYCNDTYEHFLASKYFVYMSIDATHEVYFYITDKETVKENLFPDYGSVSSDADIEIIFDEGSEDEGYSPSEEHDDGSDGSGDTEFTTTGALTTTYAMTLSRLRTLGQFIWNNSIFDDIKLINNSPIENIISIMAFPISTEGSDSPIQLGNITANVNGIALGYSTLTTDEFSTNIPIKDAKKYGFLNFAPYTTVTLHLPYIGFVELDPSKVMGKNIYVRYIIDLITGTCKAMVSTNIDGTKRVINEFNGQMGIEIPLTASNRAQIQAGWISAGVGTAVSLIGGGASIGAIQAAGMSSGVTKMMTTNMESAMARGTTTSVIDAAMAQYHYSSTSNGSPSVTAASKANREIYVIIDRPTVDISSKFNHTHGRMCNMTRKIGKCKGYTLCNPNIGLGDINCTVNEKEEIVSILSTGFFAATIK